MNKAEKWIESNYPVEYELRNSSDDVDASKWKLKELYRALSKAFHAGYEEGFEEGVEENEEKDREDYE